MNAQQLIDTATMMVAGDKGLLAMDESTPMANTVPQWNLRHRRNDADE